MPHHWKSNCAQQPPLACSIYDLQIGTPWNNPKWWRRLWWWWLCVGPFRENQLQVPLGWSVIPPPSPPTAQSPPLPITANNTGQSVETANPVHLIQCSLSWLQQIPVSQCKSRWLLGSVVVSVQHNWFKPMANVWTITHWAITVLCTVFVFLTRFTSSHYGQSVASVHFW